MRKLLVVVSILISFVATGCQYVGQNRYNREISLYLPNIIGFTWNYSGFAEYDHRMKLDSIQRRGGATIYNITGEVGDPSGGEAERDFSLNITYTIENGVWVQEKEEEAMMDSEFDRLEILRGPVREGTTWTQQQTDHQGKVRTLDCTIEEIRHQTVSVLVVMYRERGSEYYEKREITTGMGITLFEKLWISPEGNFPIGYQLFEGF